MKLFTIWCAFWFVFAMIYSCENNSLESRVSALESDTSKIIKVQPVQVVYGNYVIHADSSQKIDTDSIMKWLIQHGMKHEKRTIYYTYDSVLIDNE